MIKLYSGFRVRDNTVSVPCEYCGTVVIEFLHDKIVDFDVPEQKQEYVESLRTKISGMIKPFSFKDEVAVVCDKCRAKLPKTKKERDLCDEWDSWRGKPLKTEQSG